MENKNLAVYSSSAGSGKTYTLVKEYLKIVINDPVSFRSVLAITFTNKAANEMKERVINYLRHLSEPAENHDSVSIKFLLPELEETLNLPATIIAQRASRVLSLILHNYSDFAISTIDSFVYKIIRTFSYDINIPFDYAVELNTGDLIKKAVDVLVSQAGKDRNLTDLLIHFMHAKADREENWHIEGDLRKFGNSLLDEESLLYLKLLKGIGLKEFFKISRYLTEEIRKFEKSLTNIAKEAIRLIELKNIEVGSFSYGNRGIYKYFKYLADSVYTHIHPNKSVIGSIEKDAWTSGKANPEDVQNILSIKNDLRTSYDKIQELVNQNGDKYKIFNLLARNIYPMALLNEIERVVEELKLQNRIIPISEFNKKIAEIVLNEPVPFIYERLGEKYKHFLIDEFQDTSILQWQNLLPLVDNSLAYGHFNMLVGDGKQSIYRWRNGEVEQFASLPKIYKKQDTLVADEREKTLERNFDKQNLKKNYRSFDEIIGFNNNFFETVKDALPDSVKPVYDDIRQEAFSDKKGGFVQIEFFDKDKHEESWAEYNAKRVEETIIEAMNDGYKLKDVAILCRRNNDASELAKHLIKNGIDVISSQSLLLKSSAEVRFIVSVYNYLRDRDMISGTEILYYLSVSEKLNENSMKNWLKRESIRKEKKEDKITLKSILFENGFEFDHFILQKMALYDLAEEIIRIFTLNKRSDPYLIFFLEEIMNFNIGKSTSLADFLDYWNEKKDELSIKAPEGAEAVRIMTIHKAKGLEFPLVIFPFAKTDQFRLTKKFLWLNIENEDISGLPFAMISPTKDLEETRFAEDYEEEYNKTLLDLVNVMYVAMTRPSERLYIISGLSSKNSSKTNSMQGLFRHFLSVQGLWEEEKEIYSFGSRQMVSNPESREEGVQLKSMISNDWKQNIILSTTAPDIWDVENPDKNREWGKLVHYVLSRINTIDDLTMAVEKLQSEGLIDDQEINKLTELLNELFSDTAVRRFFEPGLTIKNEAEILMPDGSGYRPDRLIIEGTDAIVLDYKTGKKEEKHKAQINKYAKILNEMGFEKVKRYLLYIDLEDKVLEVMDG